MFHHLTKPFRPRETKGLRVISVYKDLLVSSPEKKRKNKTSQKTRKKTPSRNRELTARKKL